YNNKEIGNVTSTNVTGLQKENDYYYRVRSYNESGTSDNSNVIHVTTPNSIDLLNNCIPDKYFLYCNFPNPFNPTTSISYDIPEKSNVKITILDISGRVVENLVDKTQEPGHYQISWDASGHPVGVYLYRITAGQFTDVKKCILLK
ncbi:MAG: T9SS type A sorting domain-containing protein, partial [Bacteroidales bacterium]|nr:T9SS type A sorting domain-containing protein [Bacteroidales bacterium]